MSSSIDSPQTRTALITGASSGIGAAFAEAFARDGFDLVLTARRESRLRDLAERLARDHRVRVEVMPFDLTQPGAVAALCDQVSGRHMTIDALVHSAGFGTAGGYLTPQWKVHHDALQLMVVAASELTYRLLPGMIERGYGRIIHVASTAGLAPTGAGTMYGAAKTFVVHFCESLSREVARHGVHVTAVCPGLTRTEFHEQPELRATVTRMPAWMWMHPADVAREGVRAAMAGRTVCVPGVINRAMVTALRYAPLSLLRRAARLVLGLRSRRVRLPAVPAPPARS